MNVLITGASRGIGFAVVQKLLADDCHTIIALARNIKPLQALTAENPQLSRRLFAYEFDITDFDAQSCGQRWAEIVSSVDVLLNNAGTLVKKPFIELSLEDWRQTYEVNLFGCVKLLQTLYPLLKQSPAPHVVNIGSMGGHPGTTKFPELAAYSSSKAALANLTECLAEEWKAEQISVNCLLFGAVNTQLMAEAFPGYQAQVNPAEAAEFIVNFALTGHKLFNGKALPVSVTTP